MSLHLIDDADIFTNPKRKGKYTHSSRATVCSCFDERMGSHDDFWSPDLISQLWRSTQSIKSHFFFRFVSFNWLGSEITERLLQSVAFELDKFLYFGQRKKLDNYLNYRLVHNFTGRKCFQIKEIVDKERVGHTGKGHVERGSWRSRGT